MNLIKIISEKQPDFCEIADAESWEEFESWQEHNMQQYVLTEEEFDYLRDLVKQPQSESLEALYKMYDFIDEHTATSYIKELDLIRTELLKLEKIKELVEARHDNDYTLGRIWGIINGK